MQGLIKRLGLFFWIVLLLAASCSKQNTLKQDARFYGKWKVVDVEIKNELKDTEIFDDIALGVMNFSCKSFIKGLRFQFFKDSAKIYYKMLDSIYPVKYDWSIYQNYLFMKSDKDSVEIIFHIEKISQDLMKLKLNIPNFDISLTAIKQ